MSLNTITCQLSLVVYSKRLRMVIDAMGGALQLETGNSDVYKFISGRTYDTV
jgi:hypothetical protein